MKRTGTTARKWPSALASVLALALIAAIPPVAAEATFPGKPGPIAYSRSFTSETEFGGGIVAHGPRVRDRTQRLTTTHGDGSPSYSADGRSIAFTGNREPPATGSGDSHVYVMKSDGSDVRQLTGGGVYDSNPSFSPDGRRIVFDRAVGGNRTFDIYSVNVDGTGLRQLTKGPSSDYEPTFTPNGRRIVFVSNRDHDTRTDRSDIFAMRPDGSRMRVLIDGPRNESEPDVSPNGRRIVYMSSRDGGLKASTRFIR